MNNQGQPGHGWTVVLRRRPARIVEGRPEGGYTDEYEIICCDCGDDPALDYREISPELQRIRGPYPIAAGITAYVKHTRRHPRPPRTRRLAGRPARNADRRPAAGGLPGSGYGQPGQGSVSSQVEHGEMVCRVPTMVERR
jgi:hypothetical protein